MILMISGWGNECDVGPWCPGNPSCNKNGINSKVHNFVPKNMWFRSGVAMMHLGKIWPKEVSCRSAMRRNCCRSPFIFGWQLRHLPLSRHLGNGVSWVQMAVPLGCSQPWNFKESSWIKKTWQNTKRLLKCSNRSNWLRCASKLWNLLGQCQGSRYQKSRPGLALVKSLGDSW